MTASFSENRVMKSSAEHDSSSDDHLSRDVQTVEIFAGVRFGVTRRFRHRHRLRKRALTVPRVEKKAHRAGEDALHRFNFVARRDERSQR